MQGGLILFLVQLFDVLAVANLHLCFFLYTFSIGQQRIILSALYGEKYALPKCCLTERFGAEREIKDYNKFS